MLQEKRCVVCGVEKPLTEFYKHPQCRDGHRQTCKTCTNKSRKPGERPNAPTQTEAGARNLAKWKAENPAGGNVKHGVTSQTVKKRYGDKRTAEGKQLQGIMDSLAEDLGGPENLTAAQQVVLAGLRGKIIVLLCMSKWLDSQETVINSEGELSGFLKDRFLAYTESAGKDLERLVKLTKKANSRLPTIEDLIK